ncbi:hypothetical protein KXS15_24395 [Sinorhizobium meliloti]|uniref:hypothetical protein n=1 Tax=Rhizobium meliloti TaxID=382 RepID=UPI003F178C33
MSFQLPAAAHAEPHVGGKAQQANRYLDKPRCFSATFSFEAGHTLGGIHKVNWSPFQRYFGLSPASSLIPIFGRSVDWPGVQLALTACVLAQRISGIA